MIFSPMTPCDGYAVRILLVLYLPQTFPGVPVTNLIFLRVGHESDKLSESSLERNDIRRM